MVYVLKGCAWAFFTQQSSVFVMVVAVEELLVSVVQLTISGTVLAAVLLINVSLSGIKQQVLHMLCG